MISKEVLQKIKQINIKSKYLATEVFAGEYESAFRGRGMEFEEVRNTRWATMCAPLIGT